MCMLIIFIIIKSMMGKKVSANCLAIIITVQTLHAFETAKKVRWQRTSLIVVHSKNHHHVSIIMPSTILLLLRSLG